MTTARTIRLTRQFKRDYRRDAKDGTDILSTPPSALSYKRSLPTNRPIPGTATTPWPEPGKAAATVTSGPISYSYTASAAPMSSNSSSWFAQQTGAVTL